MSSRPRVTYRVQLTPEFGFERAAAIVPYLARLGVSHLYCSPYLQAAPGSTHGYDVVDPGRVNEELGGEGGHRALVRALAEHGLGQVLDIVPNHMAIGGRANRWWWDVLENGPSSRYASYFDVSWDPPEHKLQNTILVPVLGDHYGRVLEAGELRLARQAGRLLVRYFEHEFPVDPRSYGMLLGLGFGDLARRFSELPVLVPEDRAGAEARQREVEALVTRLGDGTHEARLEARIAEVNADPDALDSLLDRQNYRLARWQVAGRELDYRRFFDVNTLAGIRVEDPAVFAETHRLVLEWVHAGELDGLRVDHPDGLRDPRDYFDRLRAAAPTAWMVGEKILQPGERLPAGWPIEGTTGYDFLNRVQGVFVDTGAEAALTDVYRGFAPEIGDYGELIHESKHLVMRELLASDLDRLAALFVRVCEDNRRFRDYTRHELNGCLRETIACLGVYRTYARPPDPGSLTEQDRTAIDSAVAAARARRPDLDPELFEFLGAILRLEVAGGAEAELVARFQQTSGPVTAKGVEDTAFYIYNRLVALNEVGGDPSRFGVGLAEFHAACGEAANLWPEGMLTTSTHDTKRSEDVRCRLAVLSEVPSAWRDAVHRWSELNDRHRTGGAPDPNTEYLLYQTLVGAWPISAERVLAYMEKATREAKVHTSWIAPDAGYERALRTFTEGALGDPAFVADLAGFAEILVGPGRVNSLALKLVTLTAPGVPDLYQGSELWSLALVDPDNRRPVDYEERRRLLEEIDRLGPAAAAAGLARAAEGIPKLLVVRRALELRAERPELFAAGSAYRPLAVDGPRSGNALAFSRGGGAVTVVPRFPLTLASDWRDTKLELPAGDWTERLTGSRLEGGRVALGELLAGFPVALLARDR